MHNPQVVTSFEAQEKKLGGRKAKEGEKCRAYAVVSTAYPVDL